MNDKEVKLTDVDACIDQFEKSLVTFSESFYKNLGTKATPASMIEEGIDQGLMVVGHCAEEPVVLLSCALIRIRELEEEVRNLSDLATSLAETQVHPQVSETKEPELTWTGNLLKVTAI